MSDNQTTAAPAVASSFLFCPCAACGAEPAPAPASHCWWCGEEIIIAQSIAPARFSLWVRAKLVGYLALMAAASYAVRSTILKKGLLAFLKALRTQVMHRLIRIERRLSCVNEGSRIGFGKLVSVCLYVPVAILSQLSLNLTSIFADILHLALCVQDRSLCIYQAAQKITHGPLKLRVGREVLNAFRNAYSLLRCAQSGRNRCCNGGEVKHGRCWQNSLSF